MLTNLGRYDLANAWAGSNTIPRYVGVGSGSGTVAVGNSGLVAAVGSRADFTSRDLSVLGEVTWIHDFSSVRMSGLTLSEIGMFNNQVLGSGTLFSRECFGGVVFDGTNELQVQTTYQVF